MTDKAEYREYVKKNAPGSPMFRSVFAAFLVGGIICCIGEGVSDAIKAIFPDMSENDIGSWCDNVHQRTFSRSVWPQQSIDAGAQRQIYFPQRGFLSVIFVNSLKLQFHGSSFGLFQVTSTNLSFPA